MNDSKPTLLRVAVNGNSCRPKAEIAARWNPPTLLIELALAEGMAAGDFECTDILTTHALEIQLSEPVDLDQVVISVLDKR